MLADREADTFADWLGAHPGTTVICRDRAGAYAEAAERGAPNAVQVADRWHLWHNLAEQVEKTIAAHHGCLREEEIPPEAPAAPTDVAQTADLVAAADTVHAARRANSGLVTRSTVRFEQVQALKAQGKGIKPIMRELGLAKETVRKFYRATSVEEVTATSHAGRPSMLDKFKPYLHERFTAGITNASALFREIREQGYPGSRATLADYLAPFRAVGAAPAPKAATPKVRHVTSWMLHHPDDLDDEQRLQLKQVLDWCLVSLGVAPKKVPDDVAQRAALYRSVTWSRRIALLLDDAVSAVQVRSVLPAGPGSVAVVTSRSRLSGLAIDGARWVEVAPLGEVESLRVLEGMVGTDRVSGEEEAARKLVRLCGGLPLALVIAGARLSSRPQRALRREVDELTGERQRLNALRLDEDTSVAAVLDSAYASLTDEAQYVYRMCSAHPGREFGLEVAAAATGTSPKETEDAAESLLEANFLTEVDDRRFAYHDLLRVHARQRGDREDGVEERSRATRRVIDWYLDRVVAADMVIHPLRQRLGPRYQRTHHLPTTFGEERAALMWLENERTNVRSVVDVAADREWHQLVWQMCEALWGFFLHTRHYEDWITMHRVGIASAESCGDRRAEARLRSQLGFAYAKMRRYEDAVAENTRALRLAEAEHDEQARATALSQLGRAARGMNDLAAALRYFRQSRDIQEGLQQWRGVALCRRRIGDILAQLGEYEEAATELRTAATDMAELGDSTQHARTLLFLGKAHQRAGRTDLANETLREALTAVRALGSPYYQAEVLAQLGSVAEQIGDLDAASRNYREAGDLYASAEDPQADVMRSRLAALGNR